LTFFLPFLLGLQTSQLVRAAVILPLSQDVTPPNTSKQIHHGREERHGYFVADLDDTAAFNRTVTLRDSWTKPNPAGVTQN
jgi:acyl-CoA thioesterase